MLEDRFAQHNRIPGDKYIAPTEETYMDTYDYIVRPTANAASGSYTIYLPRVAEARGRWYSIIARAIDDGKIIAIADRDDSECWSDLSFTAACDRALLYSDGLAWHAAAVLIK